MISSGEWKTEQYLFLYSFDLIIYPGYSARTCSGSGWQYLLRRRSSSILAIVLTPAVAAYENIRLGIGPILSVAIVLASAVAADENIRRGRCLILSLLYFWHLQLPQMRISGVEEALFYPSYSSGICSCCRWEYPAWQRPYSILTIFLAPAVVADENIRRGGGLILS